MARSRPGEISFPITDMVTETLDRSIQELYDAAPSDALLTALDSLDDLISESEGGIATDPHDLVGSTHAVSGLTTGHVLQATAATTFAFGAVPAHALIASHTVSGLTTGHVLTATGATSFDFQAVGAPAAHVLVSASHTASGLTTGHALKATSATTFAFGAIAEADIADGAVFPRLGANETITGQYTFNANCSFPGNITGTPVFTGGVTFNSTISVGGTATMAGATFSAAVTINATTTINAGLAMGSNDDITLSGSGAILNLTNDATVGFSNDTTGANTPSLGTNCPVTGSPDTWIKVFVDGIESYIPVWQA